MTQEACAQMREWIPDVASGRVSAVAVEGFATHMEACAECRDELELVGTLHAAPYEVPEGLADRVVLAVRNDRRAAPRRGWWGLTAAAVAALALGIGVVSEPGADGLVPLVPEFAAEVELDDDEVWLSDDGLLAGAPALEALSDEDLAVLIDELAMGSAGGSV